MGNVSKENNMLKLIRPRGIVELYPHPIKAAQVMERHPRHFVTRPDVFKFPYLVVKPESILKPGRVFFIVPYHTIYRLLKSRVFYDKQTLEYANQPMVDDTRLVCPSLNKALFPHIKDIDTSFFHHIIPVGNSQNKKQSDRHELNATPRNQHVLTENRANSIFKNGGYESNGVTPSRKKGGGLVEMRKDGASMKTSTMGLNLKPCLRKNQTNKTQSIQGPRVRFTLPDEEDDDDENWDTDFSYF